MRPIFNLPGHFFSHLSIVLQCRAYMLRLYQIMSATQLNEAEYAGPFAAALLYLAATGATEPSAAATLAVFGQVRC